jgi:hypothetical protein
LGSSFLGVLWLVPLKCDRVDSLLDELFVAINADFDVGVLVAPRRVPVASNYLTACRIFDDLGARDLLSDALAGFEMDLIFGARIPEVGGEEVGWLVEDHSVAIGRSADLVDEGQDEVGVRGGLVSDVEDGPPSVEVDRHVEGLASSLGPP